MKVESFWKLKPCRHVLVLLSQSWKLIIASFALLFAFWEALWEALWEVEFLSESWKLLKEAKRERATHWETHRNAEHLFSQTFPDAPVFWHLQARASNSLRNSQKAFIHINTHRVSKAAACERAQRSTEILAYPHWSSSKTLRDSKSSQRETRRASWRQTQSNTERRKRTQRDAEHSQKPVSYTHLTLPTICSV